MSLVHSCSVRKTIIHLGIHMVETNGYNNWNCCPLTYLEEFPFSILWTFLWVSLYFYSLITWQTQWITKSLVLSLLKSLVSWLPLHLQLTLSGYYHPLSERYSCLLTALLIVRCFLPQCVSIQLPASNFPHDSLIKSLPFCTIAWIKSKSLCMSYRAGHYLAIFQPCKWCIFYLFPGDMSSGPFKTFLFHQASLFW